ncbi:uncharacterized protein EI90DRAFT_1764052 [Cantharellus anzutake]|uniref:uncharacterized protein n=1 Tax=Cantharellus anzutake TaxID=1750568 RepID=UPI001903EC6C|nr:uncharacterized protein EI90DRAFT_1764052 [Cantharellus anzutake]KAF8341674.1 hypothetical protein EI90DRAFT_1764052 [Cantharellus anzutake]
MAKKDDYHRRFSYVIKYLLKHLDPSQLFSQESIELQNEFNSFITQKYILTFMHLQWCAAFPAELLQCNNHHSIQLLRGLHEAAETAADAPWELYRSKLPFAPPSSSLYKQYGHLADPVRIFSAFGEFSGGTIPLSRDLLIAQEVMQAKLSELPEVVNQWGGKAINYEAEFHEPDVRNGIVTCAALSLDGRYIALGFGSGIIEVADINHQRTICRLQHSPANLPTWIEFVHGSCRVVTEDNDGNVMILSDGMTPVNLGTLPTGPYPAGTTVSDNGLFVVRVPRNLDNPWYNNMMLVSVSEAPSIQPLTSPPFSSESHLSSHCDDNHLTTPHCRTLGFSPAARYVGAFDGTRAVTWSTESCQCIAGYQVTNFNDRILNPNVPLIRSYLIPDPIFTRATLPLAEGDTGACAHHSDADGEHDTDESWIKRTFYDLSPSNLLGRVGLHDLPAAMRTSPINLPLLQSSVCLHGRNNFVLPWDYRPIDSQHAWYGHRVPYDPLKLYRPQSSRDGTRFLVQGESRAPIVVDISQVV